MGENEAKEAEGVYLDNQMSVKSSARTDLTLGLEAVPRNDESDKTDHWGCRF